METSSPPEVSLTRQSSPTTPPSQTNISASPSPLKTGNACSPSQSARSTSAPRLSAFANIHHFDLECLTGDPRVARTFFSDITPGVTSRLLVKLFVVRSSRKGTAEGPHLTSLPVRTVLRSL